MPRLTLRLPGTWIQLDPHRPDVTAGRIRSFVDLVIGRADQLAYARREMRTALEMVMDQAPTTSALESTFVCHQLAPGTATPVAVSIFSPAQFHMSPAIGNQPATVIEAFLATLDVLGDGSDWLRIGCVDGEAVRRWCVTESVVADGTEDLAVRTFVAHYWRTVPSSKRVALVTVTSPLADIPRTLLRLADAIVGGSRFVAA